MVIDSFFYAETAVFLYVILLTFDIGIAVAAGIAEWIVLYIAKQEGRYLPESLENIYQQSGYMPFWEMAGFLVSVAIFSKIIHKYDMTKEAKITIGLAPLFITYSVLFFKSINYLHFLFIILFIIALDRALSLLSNFLRR